MVSLKAGIVGLPNVGKSTLFNAITKQNILAANYPFATIEPNVGVVLVPDKRIDFLKDLYQPKSVVPTTFEFTDIAGLVAGASKGEGLGNKFLSHIREVDAIVEVVRCFIDSNVTHVSGKVDPVSDVEVINIELVLADLEIVTNRLDKITKKAIATKNKEALLEVDILNKCKSALENNIPLRRLNLDSDEIKIIKNFSFLTLKPIIYVANIGEDDIAVGDNEYSLKLKDYANSEGSSVIVMCSKLEAELATLLDDEKCVFLQEMGINNSGLDKLILATYNLLGLKTFFTAGSDEVKAWTFITGMKAPQCAGLIHSDIERGFIKAQVMSYDDLQTLGCEKDVKEAGKLRIEGKDYIVEDGDICYFRFNV